MVNVISRFFLVIAFFWMGHSSLLHEVNIGKLTAGTMLNKASLACIYTATKDGFDCQSFHTKVDVGLPSIVLASVQSGGIAGLGGVTELIGGYTPFGYQSINDYRNTAKAFVFLPFCFFIDFLHFFVFSSLFGPPPLPSRLF